MIRLSSWEPWTREAACVGEDPEWWFSDHPVQQAAAVRVCRVCPVAGDCAGYAQRHRIIYGIWGGRQVGPRRRAA